MFEALVARVRYHIQKANFMGLKEAESTLLLAEAADAIEELQAQINGWIEMERKALIKSVLKWINVKERLPEKSGLYLTYHAKRGSMTMHYSANNKAWNAFDHEDEPKYALEVTHWMPISEPPEVMEND